MNSDALIQAVQNLFSLLEQRQIKYVLVGGVAVLNYVEGRNTQDLDLLMPKAALEALPELTISHRDMYFAQAKYGDLPIDILLTQNPLFKKVYDLYSVKEHFLDRDVSIATVEGLILLKLYALPSLYRQGNFARVGINENDIASLLYYYRPDTKKLLEELSQFISETDRAEVRTILTELQGRAAKFNRPD